MASELAKRQGKGKRRLAAALVTAALCGGIPLSVGAYLAGGAVVDGDNDKIAVGDRPGVAIGSGAAVKAANGVAIGEGASVGTGTYGNAVAIGGFATVMDGSDDSIAIGSSYETYDDDYEQDGKFPRTTVSGQNSVAIGNAMTMVNGNNNVAIGSDAEIGMDRAQIDASRTFSPSGETVTDSVALGYHTEVTKTQGTAVGSGATVNAAGGIALGQGSVASAEAGVLGYDPATRKNSSSDSATWKSTSGALSLGGMDSEGNMITRQITNVAAGTADTDAVNIAQLKNAAAAATTKVESGDAAQISVADTVNADGSHTYAVDVVTGKVAKGDQGLVTGDTVYNETRVAEDGNYIKKDNSAAANIEALDNQVKQNADDIGKNAEAIGKGLNFQGDAGDVINKKLGDTLVITGGAEGALTEGNIGVAAKDGALNIQLAKDVDLGADGSLTVAGTVINGDAINAGDKQITHVKSGLDGVAEGTDILDVSGDTLNNGATIGDIQTAAQQLTDKGLVFAANDNAAGVTNALGSKVSIVGTAEKEGHTYAADNLTTRVEQDAQGATTITVLMDKDITANKVTVGEKGEDGVNGHVEVNGTDGSSVAIDGEDGISVKGEDGKDGVSIKGETGEAGTEGHIIISGAGGTSIDISVQPGTDKENGEKGARGVDGKDGKDGLTRVVYTDETGATHQTATMEDGLKYSGDFGDSANVKLNNEVYIKGEAKNEQDLTTGNIGVVASQDGDNGQLLVRLNKDIDLTKDGSVTIGDTKISDNTIQTGGTTIEGDTITSHTYNGDTLNITREVNVGGNTYITPSGIDGNNQKITNIADGELQQGSKDAVNGGQLWQTNQNLDKLDDRLSRVGAGAAALAALHPLDFDPDAKWDFAAGYGNYRGANAVAVGAYYRPNEDVMFSIGSSMGGGENMVNAGVSIKLGAGSSHVSTSRVAMAKEIKSLRDTVAQLTVLVNSLVGSQHKIQNSLSREFPDVPENHWAYEAVQDLATKNLVIGYPDGQFKGDRQLTRYEFAQIVYRALQAGADVDVRLVEEFKPELEFFRIDTITTDENGAPVIQRVRVNK